MHRLNEKAKRRPKITLMLFDKGVKVALRNVSHVFDVTLNNKPQEK